MQTPEAIKVQIRKAFAKAQYPGDRRLRNSNEGDEPSAVERDFHGKRDWQRLTPQFLDQAPEGWGSALSFFSHEAFCFYLPAYLIADIDGGLDRADPVFYLTHGLESKSAAKRINPQRYGNKTWRDYACERFAGFPKEQAAAIVAYLEFKRDSDTLRGVKRREVNEAIKNYWHGRANSYNPA
jgi:hypothetical protein